MEEVLAMCRELPERDYAPGEELMAEGGSSGHILVLVDGVVEVYRGDVLVVRLSEPGVFLGEIAALLGTPHSARVVAAAPTRVRVIEDPVTAFGPSSGLLLEMARLLARRLHAMTSYLVDVERQYAGESGHLGMMHEVLGELMSVRSTGFVPGSAREDVPDY